MLETSEEQYQKVLDLNLKSNFFGTQLAARQFIAEGTAGGDPEYLLRVRGLVGAGHHRYCVAKGGMRMITRTAGVERCGRVDDGPGR